MDKFIEGHTFFVTLFKLLQSMANTGRMLPTACTTLQRQNTEISKQIFPEKEYRGLSPNVHIHVSVSDLYMYSHDGSPYSAGGNM
jgi:hypothetical protein